MNDSNDSPWYADGLRFECTRCGDCCAGKPGYVWVELDEIRRLAEYVELSLEEFGARFLRRVGERVSLVETREFDCVFWDSQEGCQVYEARPQQCRTWPFWQANLSTPEAWSRTQQVCPGAGRGPIISLETIRASAARSPQ